MDKSFLISGSGGQGVLSIGTILASIFMYDGLEVVYCPCYGAEVRGGAVNCEITMSDKEINNFNNEKVDYVIALNQTSLDKFTSKVKKGGTIIVNSAMAKTEKTREDIEYVFAPLSEEAAKMGNIKMTNSIALGILLKLLGNFNIESVEKAYGKVLSNKVELIENNLKAFNFGLNYF